MFLEILVNESQINFAVFLSWRFFLSLTASVAYAGGLDTATNTMTELKTWAFGFGGVCALCYLIYNIIMAFMEKKKLV
ncbi:conjugal transfer prepropilin [Escherichia coli]|nr:conjugal transfer prepropilin [Escherichia coli]